MENKNMEISTCALLHTEANCLVAIGPLEIIEPLMNGHLRTAALAGHIRIVKVSGVLTVEDILPKTYYLIKHSNGCFDFSTLEPSAVPLGSVVVKLQEVGDGN